MRTIRTSESWSNGLNTEPSIPWGVIFDMDGVLIDSAEPHFQSWVLLAGELGTTITREQYTVTFGRRNEDVIPALFGPTPAERLPALAARKEEHYRRLVRRDPPIMPGAVELLHALHQSGARLAVGSSGPRVNVELMLEAMRTQELFRAVICGEDVARGKPDPQVFQLAAQRMELAPGRCVVIEDAPAGVQAARAAGTRAQALLTTHSREAFDRLPSTQAPHAQAHRLADLSVQSLRELVHPSSSG